MEKAGVQKAHFVAPSKRGSIHPYNQHDVQSIKKEAVTQARTIRDGLPCCYQN